MEIEEKDLKFLRILGGFAGAGVLLIVVAHFLPASRALTKSLTSAIGDALIVAAVLGLTVDRYLKEYLVRKVSKDVYAYLVGYNLPDEIKQRLQALMGIALIRRNWQIAYVLTPIESEQDKVLIDVSYSFELENISNTVQPYTQRVQGEKHLNPAILELRCDDPESQFRLIAKTGESLGKDQDGVPGVIEAHGPEINVKPSGKTGLRYPIRGHYQLRTFCNHSDTFSFSHPSIGVTITATYPAGYKISIEPEPDTVITDNMWQFRKRAFLHSEHVMVRWFKT